MVGAVAIDAAQRPGGAADPLHAQRVGDRIGARAHVRLDQLRQRVQPRAGGDRGRQRVGQLGIDQRHLRQHHRAAQARLHAMLRRRQHGIARDLAAGPGGGRHGDKGQRRDRQRAPFSHHFQKIQRLAAVGGDDGNRLSGVDRAAAAHGNHDIATSLAHAPRAVANQIDRRLAGNGQALRRERRDQPRRALAGCAGDHQRAHAEAAHQLGQRGGRALAEDDAGCGGKFEAHGFSLQRREKRRCTSRSRAARPSSAPPRRATWRSARSVYARSPPPHRGSNT